jgi:hypothetical protein
MSKTNYYSDDDGMGNNVGFCDSIVCLPCGGRYFTVAPLLFILSTLAFVFATGFIFIGVYYNQAILWIVGVVFIIALSVRYAADDMQQIDSQIHSYMLDPDERILRYRTLSKWKQMSPYEIQKEMQLFQTNNQLTRAQALKSMHVKESDYRHFITRPFQVV